MDTIGLIAGNGRFPLLFAREARRRGMRVVAAAIRGDTFPGLRFFVDRVAWFHPGELRKLFRYFKETGVEKVLMAGQVSPERLFDGRIRLDEEFRDFFEALRDRRADTIFAAVADHLAAYGMELMDSTFLLQDHMAPRGTWSRRGPSEAELEDLRFGMEIARRMGALDVGQTVVIQGKAIVAVEAMEGTDRCIRRGGRIARRGAVVVKTSKPQQDRRFDVPVIGPRTLRIMARVRASCLGVEAGRTLVIDRETCTAIAGRADIALVGLVD